MKLTNEIDKISCVKFRLKIEHVFYKLLDSRRLFATINSRELHYFQRIQIPRTSDDIDLIRVSCFDDSLKELNDSVEKFIIKFK